MSRGPDGRDGVDFVVGADAGADEDLPQPSPPRDPQLRWKLAGGAAVLLIAAVLVRGGGHGRPHASPSTSTSVPAGPFTPPPDLVGSGNELAPVGNRPTFGRTTIAGCPSDAQCGRTASVPPELVTAVRALYPGATVRSASTVTAYRTGRFEPDVLSRSAVLTAGSRTVTVTVRKPKAGDISECDVRTVGRQTVSHAVAAGAAFTVSIEVRQPTGSAPVTLRRLAGLAADGRLTEPE